MTDATPHATPAAPKWTPLDARQRRVLGVLIEKAKTTPAAYPITVNALVTGCNQKNNRDPLTAYDDIDVEKALDQLRTLGVVSEIDWMGRVSKYKHHAYEWLGVSKPEIAVMTELLLRGAQALGDLRGRAARMEPIADLAALKPIVDALVARGLMVELTPAGRGQLVSHNLYLPEELAELKSSLAGHSARAAAADEDTPRAQRVVAAPTMAAAGADRVAALNAEVAELRAELAALRERVSTLETLLR
jgi:uncharacterized protein YceH (UPF0502 family)